MATQLHSSTEVRTAVSFAFAFGEMIGSMIQVQNDVRAAGDTHTLYDHTVFLANTVSANN